VVAGVCILAGRHFGPPVHPSQGYDLEAVVAFNYLAALWIITGSGPAHWHTLGGAVVLRGAVWLFVPVSWHLNWLFPKTLARMPGLFWWAFYGLAGALVILEWFSVIPEWVYEWGFILAEWGSSGFCLCI
jgi:hypothetical protein